MRRGGFNIAPAIPRSAPRSRSNLAGRSNEARTQVNAVLTANPANAEALYYLGRIDLDQKKYDDAVIH